MDKARAREIQAALTAVVTAHPEWGVKITSSRASYGSNELRVAMTLVGTSTEGEREAFERVSRFYGVKAEAYGAEIPGYGKLIGFNTKRPKYPVRVNRNRDSREALYPTAILYSLPANLRMRT